MLDSTKAEKVARECIRQSRDFWGIDAAWEIKLEFKGLKEGVSAQCERQTPYRRAWIDVDLNQVETYESLWEDVAHEMAHIVAADFDLYRDVLEPEEGARPKSVELVWLLAQERTTMALQRVFTRERPYKAKKS